MSFSPQRPVLLWKETHKFLQFADDFTTYEVLKVL